MLFYFRLYRDFSAQRSSPRPRSQSRAAYRTGYSDCRVLGVALFFPFFFGGALLLKETESKLAGVGSRSFRIQSLGIGRSSLQPLPM